MSYQYDLYLQKHKANVKKGFDWLQTNMPWLFEGKPDAAWQTEFEHDASKSKPDEYEAYDAYFYGGNRSYAVVQAFQRAWLLHIHRNPHHWQHWVLINDDPGEGEVLLEMYVNDAIGYKMTPEQILYYSPNCFGTADAISFRGDILRIHDLKTGESPTHMEQLMIYAALFCLEYNYKPNEIQMELRIYQNDGIICHQPTIEDIFPIMDRIITFDKIINSIKEEE